MRNRLCMADSDIASAKVLLFFEICKREVDFLWKIRIIRSASLIRELAETAARSGRLLLLAVLPARAEPTRGDARAQKARARDRWVGETRI